MGPRPAGAPWEVYTVKDDDPAAARPATASLEIEGDGRAVDLGGHDGCRPASGGGLLLVTGTSGASRTVTPTGPAPSTDHVAIRLSTLDRFLPAWIGLAMVAGLVLGRIVPGLGDGLSAVEVQGCRSRSRSGCSS